MKSFYNRGNRLFLLVAVLFFSAIVSVAQVGYQVSLLNTATGEPRCNVTVNAQVTITDADGKLICTENKSATSNEFGVLSLTVGNENTFKNLGTSKLPLYISVQVDGTLIGKTQILSVPVAEVAKQVMSSFTRDELVGEWKSYYPDHGNCYEVMTLLFYESGTVKQIGEYYDNGQVRKEGEGEGEYIIEGNNINVFMLSGSEDFTASFVLRYHKNKLWQMDYISHVFSKISEQ